MHALQAWLGRRPLWLYAVFAYAAGFGGWTGAVYLAAWDAGGPHTDYMGFQHGQFSYPDALVNAASLMAVAVCLEWWKRLRREAQGKTPGTRISVNWTSRKGGMSE